MGWTESPPAFSGAMKTIANMANLKLIQYPSLSKHQLEKVANTLADGDSSEDEIPVHASSANREHANKPVAYVDAYVDDLIGLAQGMSHKTLVSQAILHSIDNVFRPVEPSDHHKRQEPAPFKKLTKGDGHMATKKTILSWDIDTRRMTICLTNHRLTCLKELLDSIPR